LSRFFRFFKLRRLKELAVLEENFLRVAPSKIFHGENIFGDEYITITLKLSKEVAYRLYDEFSQYEVLPSGDFIVQIAMPKGEWIYHYIATFGEHCEVLEPQEIRQQVRNMLQKTLEKYL